MCPVYGIYVVLLTLGKVYSTVLIKEVHREIHILQHVSTMSESGTGLAEHDVTHSSSVSNPASSTQHVTPSSGK